MKLSVVFVLVAVLALSQANYVSIKEMMRKNVNTLTDAHPQLGIDWTSTINHFLQGANLTDLVLNSTDCVTNNAYMFGNITAAVSEYVRKPSINNFFGVTESLKHITPMVEACFDSFVEGSEQTMHYLEKFKFNPVLYWESFHANWKQNIFLLGVTATELKDAVFSENWELAAFKLGFLFQELLDFEPVSKLSGTIHVEGIAQNFQDLVDGLVNGTQVFGTDNVQQCVNTTRWYLESWDEAIKAFEKGTKESMRQGWMYIAQSFSKIHDVSFYCWHGTEDIAVVWYKYFDLTKPWELIYKTGHGIDKLHLGLLQLIKNVEAGNWYQAGNQWGDVLYQVYISVPGNTF